jgi:signal transduction histidine kinase
VLLSNNFFLIMASAVGIFASYIQELYIRRAYIYTQLLTEEKERSEFLLDEARAASHAKSEFLAIVSHELRTPLNAIIGFSEFLKMEMFGPLGSARYKSYAEDIHASGEHLLGVIGDILDLSKAEANKLDVNEEEVFLGAAVGGCLRMFRSKAAGEGVRLSTHLGPWPVLRADERLVKQLMINLISNAIKFTPAGGEVSISTTWEDDGGCVLTVRDTGIGIAEEDIPKVLEPFAQVESATARSHEGLGLGLPLVKKIIDLHGGSLEIKSRLGTGTTVTIRFPEERVLSWESEKPEKPKKVEEPEELEKPERITLSGTG